MKHTNRLELNQITEAVHDRIMDRLDSTALDIVAVCWPCKENNTLLDLTISYDPTLDLYIAKSHGQTSIEWSGEDEILLIDLNDDDFYNIEVIG